VIGGSSSSKNGHGGDVTHRTGPRQHIIDRLATRMQAAIAAESRRSKVTITECVDVVDVLLRALAGRIPGRPRLAESVDAIHVLTWNAFKDALEPTEDETCPTCPRPATAAGGKGRKRRR
jgi:hypothetical protein